MSQQFEKFITKELYRAYCEARKRKRKTTDEQMFECNQAKNLLALRRDILEQTYHPGSGVTFIVHEPVMREIVAAPFRDRSVHHLLYNMSAEWWDRRFIADSYSCRVGKGTLYGQKRLERHIRAVSKNYKEEAFVVKLDISGYFMSLNHDLLFERVLWGLNEQFFHEKGDKIVGVDCAPEDRMKLYQLLKYLWHEIIYDQPMKKVRIRGSRNDWNGLPKNKSLFNQPAGQGLVIGNLTSQLLSNILLDQLDRYVTLELGYKHYGRYVDDFFIVVPLEQKGQLVRDVSLIETFLRDNLKLKLHPKKRLYQYASKGIPFIGAVVYPGFIIPGRRTRKNNFEAVRLMASTGEDVENLIARMGSTCHLKTMKHWKKVFDSVGWDLNWDYELDEYCRKNG